MRMWIGIIAGGAWNVLSLWCLSQMLAAWLGPKSSPARSEAGRARRRAIIWLLVKFPLLYALLFMIVKSPSVSVVGFGIGFTATLLLALGWQAMKSRAISNQLSN